MTYHQEPAGAPMPIAALREAIAVTPPGEEIELTASDSNILTELHNWATAAGHDVLQAEREGGLMHFRIRTRME